MKEACGGGIELNYKHKRDKWWKKENPEDLIYIPEFSLPETQNKFFLISLSQFELCFKKQKHLYKLLTSNTNYPK